MVIESLALPSHDDAQAEARRSLRPETGRNCPGAIEIHYYGIPMNLSPLLEVYFRGERQLGLSFVYLGLLTIGVAYFAWRSILGSFGNALAVTALIVGVGLAVAGAWFEHKTEAQTAALEQRLTEDRETTVRDELARMEKVNANWAKARLMWLVTGLVGALLLNFVRRDAACAVGLALVFLTGVLFVVDELGERRAKIYTRALRAAHAVPR